MSLRVWLCLASLMSRIGHTVTAEQCSRTEDSVYGMYLRDHTFRTVQVGFPAECQWKCEEEVRCQSYNVIIGRNICELNSRTKEARPEAFVADGNRFYMKRAFNRAPLGSVQELPADSCGEIKSSEGSSVAGGDYWIYSDKYAGQAILARCEDTWQKVNTNPICFGARDDTYGAFFMTKTGRVKTIKLVYRSGSIKCNPRDSSSYWGCRFSTYTNKLMTIITNANREVLLPPIEDFDDAKGNCVEKYYYNDQDTGHKSTELVFRSPTSSLFLARNQELQIWYGQDFADCSEENNSGATCVDVYAWYL